MTSTVLVEIIFLQLKDTLKTFSLFDSSGPHLQSGSLMFNNISIKCWLNECYWLFWGLFFLLLLK